MGILMGIFSTLFGTTETAKKAVDVAADSIRGVGNWIDEQQFTPEEKSEAFLRAAESHLEMIKAIQNESSVRSITRRILAWSVVSTFLIMLIAAAIVYKFDPTYGDFLLGIATESMLGELTLSIGIFYFGTSLMRAFKKD